MHDIPLLDFISLTNSRSSRLTINSYINSNNYSSGFVLLRPANSTLYYLERTGINVFNTLLDTHPLVVSFCLAIAPSEIRIVIFRIILGLLLD